MAVGEILVGYKQQIDKSKRKIQESVASVPRAVRELKQTWSDKLMEFGNDITNQTTDMKPIIESTKGICDLQHVYLFSALVLILSPIISILCKSYVGKALLNIIVTPVTSAALAVLELPNYVRSFMETVETDEQRQIVMAAITGIAVSSGLMGFYCSHENKKLQFWSPPAFIVPLSIGLFVNFVNHPSVLKTRPYQMAICFLPAIFFYYLYAYTLNTFNISFIIWTLMLFIAGFIDFQMKIFLVNFQKPFSVVFQQYLTCMVFLTVSFLANSAFSTPLSRDQTTTTKNEDKY